MGIFKRFIFRNQTYDDVLKLIESKEHDGNVINHIHPKYLKEIDIAIKVTMDDYRNFNHIATSVRYDPEYLNVILCKNPLLLGTLPNSIKLNEEFIAKLIDTDKFPVQFLDYDVFQSTEFTLSFVKKFPYNFKDLPSKHFRDYEIVKAALDGDIDNFEFVDNAFKTDPDFYLPYIKKDYNAFKYVDNEHKNNSIRLSNMLNANVKLWYEISDELIESKKIDIVDWNVVFSNDDYSQLGIYEHVKLVVNSMKTIPIMAKIYPCQMNKYINRDLEFYCEVIEQNKDLYHSLPKHVQDYRHIKNKYDMEMTRGVAVSDIMIDVG